MSVVVPEVDDEQTIHAYSGTVSTSTPADTAVAAPEVVAEVVRPISVTQFTGKLKEEVAAIKIQTTFRGYLVCSSYSCHLIPSDQCCPICILNHVCWDSLLEIS